MNCTRTVQNVTKITFFEVTTSEQPDPVWFLSAADNSLPAVSFLLQHI